MLIMLWKSCRFFTKGSLFAMFREKSTANQWQNPHNTCSCTLYIWRLRMYYFQASYTVQTCPITFCPINYCLPTKQWDIYIHKNEHWKIWIGGFWGALKSATMNFSLPLSTVPATLNCFNEWVLVFSKCWSQVVLH